MKINRRDALRLGVVSAGGLVAAGGLKAAAGLGGSSRFGASHGAGGPAARRSGPSIVSRAGWGADESLRRQSPHFAPVSRFFVHHTVTPNNDPDPAATIRDIYRLHLAEGFSDVGYNFLIDSKGTIYEGRWTRPMSPGDQPDERNPAGLGTVGAHVEGHNVGAVGIAMMGTFTDVAPTAVAIDALVGLLVWLVDSYGLDPTSAIHGQPVISGHRDANETICPGDGVYHQLPNIRGAVASRLAAAARRGEPSPPTSVLIVPGGVTNVYKPRVVGRVGPSVTQVAVSFTGAGRLGQRDLTSGAQAGSFTLDASAYELPLLLGTYSVQAVAIAPDGKTSLPTFVDTDYRVVAGDLPTGYWILGSDGGVFGYGSAADQGSAAGRRLNGPLVGMAATPAGDGYWLAGGEGGTFAFGAARFHGSAPAGLKGPMVGIAPSASGNGYWLVSADGGVFAYGDAPFAGSLADRRLNSPIMGLAPTRSGRGYWLVASDGGLFAFGDAAFHGSMAGKALSSAIVGIEATPSGKGYWMVSGHGDVYPFGDAARLGSAPSRGIANLGIKCLVSSASGGGYYLLDSSGQVLAFGDAPHYGSPITSGLEVHVVGMAVRN